MKVQNFVNYMKENAGKMMKEEQVASLVNKTIEPKAYLGFNEKRELVDRIIAQSIYYRDGIFKFNGVERYMYFTMYTIEAYTNLELCEDVVADFDALSESKLLPIIICLIQKEFDDVNVFLQMQCEYVLEDNSLEAQVGRFLTNINDKFDGISDNLLNYVNSVDIGDLLKYKDDIAGVLKFIK